ncbi:hypothetical protein [Paraburkholderia sp. C35]|uniref:hypothetical protein n=1 Tax=Paraburkholderia sp. C35 TaxID=2126993 RepID=UPI000D693A18|nr:hypothetical protein [Paraburkholderia sp. C35]
MDMIRKRPAPPHERCDTTPETKPVVQQDMPAKPLDLLFPLDASTGRTDASPDTAPVSDPASDPLPTYPPLFRRIRPRHQRLAAPPTVGAPDWRLSTGAAVVLIGFAIAFGTYITLTQRDAMQSRLRRIVSQNELRATPHNDRPTIAERTQELARTLREQIETLRSRDATDAAIVAGAAAHHNANAHSSTVASSTPSLPPVTTLPVPARASPAKTPARQVAAKPPLPQPAPRPRQLASVTPTPARAHTPAPVQPERKTVVKQAGTACGPRSPCVQQVSAHVPRKEVKVAARPAPVKTRPTTVAARRAPVKVALKPAPHTMAPTVQAYAPPDSAAVLPASDDSQVYRQH